MCWRERPASRRTNVAALHTVCSHDPASRREHGTEFSTTRNESIACNQQCRCVYIWSFAESLSSIVVGICVSSIPSASSYYPSAPCPRPTANHPHAHQLPNAAAAARYPDDDDDDDANPHQMGSRHAPALARSQADKGPLLRGAYSPPPPSSFFTPFFGFPLIHLFRIAAP